MSVPLDRQLSMFTIVDGSARLFESMVNCQGLLVKLVANVLSVAVAAIHWNLKFAGLRHFWFAVAASKSIMSGRCTNFTGIPFFHLLINPYSE